MSTSLSKVCFTLMLSLALASKNSKPAREGGKGCGYIHCSSEKLIQVIHLSDHNRTVRVTEIPAALKSKLAPEKQSPASLGHRPTQLIRQLPAPLRSHHSFVLHITLIPHQQDLGIVPRVRLDLSGPVSTDSRERLTRPEEKSRCWSREMWYGETTELAKKAGLFLWKKLKLIEDIWAVSVMWRFHYRFCFQGPLTSLEQHWRSPRWWYHTWGWSPWLPCNTLWWLSCSAPDQQYPTPTHRNTNSQNKLKLPSQHWHKL